MPAYKHTLKDGKTTRWYANFCYTDWTGQKKHICKRGFKTKREAKEYEHSFLDQQSTSSDILFSSLVENYMENMEHRLKPTTIENKRNIITRKLLPYFSRLKICDIDTIKIRKWQNELIGFRDENGHPYSQTYLKTVNNQLSAILNYAVKHYGLSSNPCHAAGSIGRSRADDMKIWTRDEYERFASQIDKSSMRLAFDILFYTGIRSGELLALTPADILPDQRLSIDIVGYVSKLYGIEPGDRIFYFTKSALEKESKRTAPKAGLEPIRVHDLRHSHASLLIEMGFDILEISERLGHESAKTTLDTYSHLYPDKDTKLAGELNRLRRPDASEKDT